MHHFSRITPVGDGINETCAPVSVMALHCSGADSRQWSRLQDRMPAKTHLMLPDLHGPEILLQGWTADDFSLSVEAEPLVRELRLSGQVSHLVGHSYGGAVALHIARNHPELVASLWLYEPTAFNVLMATQDKRDRKLGTEIETLTGAISGAIEEGCEEFAAQVFTDFWGGLGAWQALNRTRRSAMIDWIIKCPLDFAALLNEPAGKALGAEFPVTFMLGQHTHPQTRRIVELLSEEAPRANTIELAGAGHLGPFVFQEKVADMVAAHISQATAAMTMRSQGRLNTANMASPDYF